MQDFTGRSGSPGLRQRNVGQGRRVDVPYTREERYEPQNPYQRLYFGIYAAVWDSVKTWLYAFGCGLLVLGALLIVLWIWWLIWYFEDRCDECYDPEDSLCNDTGQYVGFECFNQTLCEALEEQETSLDCLGDVNITDPGPGDIVIWNNETMMWENEQCDPCTNGTDGEDGICTEPCEDGIACWDINGNGLCDLQVEDVNDDGVCNQTDCIGSPGKDGINGTSATIDECEKPFGQLCLVDGATPDVVEPFQISANVSNTWFPLMGASCMIKQDNVINVSMMGCKFTVTKNDSYKITIDTSFTDNTPPEEVIWVGLSINGAIPMTKHAFPSDSGHVHTLSFSLAVSLDAGDTLDVRYYSLNSTGIIDVFRLQFTAVGELLCGFDVTGPKGDTGNTGPNGDDGFHCWDLNENYFCDLGTEDINGDGYCTVADCTLANITYDNITGDICPVLEEDAELTCMSDVNISSPEGGDYLCWSNTTNQWINGPITYEIVEGDLCPELEGESIDCMGDVVVTNATNNDLLIYETDTWVNKQAESSCASKDEGAAPYDDTILLYTFNEREGDETEDLSGFGTAVNISDGPVSSDFYWQSPCGLRSPSSGTVWRTGAGTMDKVTNAIKTSGEYSIEVWIRTASASQTGPARILSISKSGGTSCIVSDIAVSLMQDGSGFEWRMPDGACNDKIATGQLGGTHFQIQFVVTYDGTNFAIYHNGYEVLSGTQPSAIASWGTGYELSLFNTPWLIDADKRPWVGTIYKVAMWDRALSAIEVISAFKKGKCYPRECTCDCGLSFV